MFAPRRGTPTHVQHCAADGDQPDVADATSPRYRSCARRSRSCWAALRMAHLWCPAAGPLATWPAGSHGTSSSMPGRCRTGRTARVVAPIAGVLDPRETVGSACARVDLYIYMPT